MKFFYLNNQAELLVVEARNFREEGASQNWDFYTECNDYVGYLNARNDVDIDPQQALQKGIRRIERELTSCRHEIKSYHERAKTLKATADAAVLKDVSHKPILPTFREQEAARKAKEDADRLAKQEADRKRPDKLKNSIWDDGLYDFFAPMYGMTTVGPSPSPPYAAPVVAATNAAIEVTRARQQVPRAYRRSAAEVAYDAVMSPPAPATENAQQRPTQDLRDAIRAQEYAGVHDWGPPVLAPYHNSWGGWRPRADPDPTGVMLTVHPDTIEATSWPTSLPVYEPHSAPRGIQATSPFRSIHSLDWSNATPSATPSSLSVNPSTPPARP